MYIYIIIINFLEIWEYKYIINGLISVNIRYLK